MNALREIELQDIPETEEERSRFRIDSLSSLTWAMRNLQTIEDKKKKVNMVANEEIERIEMYRESELKSLTNNEDFFKSLITEYAANQRAADPKYKTEKTPYGSIVFKKQVAKWHYEEQALLAYLEENEREDLIRIKKEPVKTDIKKQFKEHEGRVYDENGQQVPGIRVDELPDKLDIKVGE